MKFDINLNKAKEYLYVAIIIALLAATYASISFVSSYADSIQPGTFRSFSASGEGKVVSIPDVAEFNFSVITQGGKDIAKIQEDNNKKINNAISFLKESDIEEKDIKTQNYNLEPQYEYYECRPVIYTETETKKVCPPPQIVGYKINQTVSVKVRDFAKVGNILSGVIEKGANSVSQLYFKIDNPNSIKNQARAEAIEKAKEKAKSIAKAGGFRLGKLISIDEGGIQPTYSYMKGMGMGETASYDSVSPTSSSIQPGSQEVTVSVTLRYEIR